MKTWKERVAEARTRGSFTKEDVSLSAIYPTCKVGERAAELGLHPTYSAHVDSMIHSGEDIPYSKGGKWDFKCHHLGSDFDLAVRANNFDEADQLLEQIDQLSLDDLKWKWS